MLPGAALHFVRLRMTTSVASDVNGTEVRCSGCRKLLLKVGDDGISYETKCQRCGRINTIASSLLKDVVIVNEMGRVLYTNCVLQNVFHGSLREVLSDISRVWGWVKDEAFYTDILERLKQRRCAISVPVENICREGIVQKTELVVTPILAPDNVIQFIVFEVRRAVDET